MSTAPPQPPGARWRALLEELPAVVGLGLVCWGVHVLWGPGWTLIAAGAPFVLAYVVRETRYARRRKP